jgi:hypothetical protein
MLAAIEAKIIKLIPLPIPRWVISSPNHISKVQPAVSEITTRKTVPKVALAPSGLPAPWVKDCDWNSNT